MKKSTWKKLFTRSKSKSATRASKKVKNATACDVCAGLAVKNVDALCSTHRNSQKQGAVTSTQSAVSPQVTLTPEKSITAPVKLSSSQTKQTSETKDATAASGPAKDDQKAAVIEGSAPTESPKPPPLVRSSTNEEFMTEEVESQNLSDNSRTEENAINETEEHSADKVATGQQEEEKPSEEMKFPSGTHSLKIRKSGSEVVESSPVSLGVKVPSQTASNKLSVESTKHESNTVVQDSTSSQHALQTPTAADQTSLVPPLFNVATNSHDRLEEDSNLNVEAKNRKNSLSSANVDSSSASQGLGAQGRRESQSSGRRVEPSSSSNNEEFMSEEVTIASGSSLDVDDADNPQSSQQLSSTITIAKSPNPTQESIRLSNHHLEIIESDDQENVTRVRRLSMDAGGMNPGNLKMPIVVCSKDSSEDLKPGVLQSQRSSKLNISFSEHVSILGEKVVNDEADSSDSLSPYENKTEVSIIETTAIISTDVPDGVFGSGRPSGTEQLITPGAESEEAFPASREDDGHTLDSGIGSEESTTSGPKETTETTSMQQNVTNDPRPTPTIIFGTISGPDHGNEWSQPLFFGPNALSPGLTLNFANQENSADQHSLQGFGVISLMRDLYDNDSSASQVGHISRVTDVTDELNNTKEEEERGQAPPSLEDEEQDQDPFKRRPKKQE